MVVEGEGAAQAEIRHNHGEARVLDEASLARATG